MASTYTMVAYGSQGSAVRQLQNELNKRGYSLDQDGIFGKKTRAAVRNYQKKNGLTMVDGIAGDETWGSLLSAPTAAEQAAQDSPGYLPNVEARRQAQPRDLDASEIEVRLGAKHAAEAIMSADAATGWVPERE